MSAPDVHHHRRQDSSSQKKKKKHLFVLLQHGSHGEPKQFNHFVEEFQRFLQPSSNEISTACTAPSAMSTEEATMPTPRPSFGITCWKTDVNELLKSDAGTVVCGQRLLTELIPALSGWVLECKKSEKTSTESLDADPSEHQFFFSAISHSFGGLIVREILPELMKSAVMKEHQVQLLTYAAIASPLCGVREMNLVMRLGGRAIGKVYSTTYQDLFLDNDVLGGRLLSEMHLKAFSQFRHRLLLPNVQGDPQVNFSTSSLLFETVEPPPPSPTLSIQQPPTHPQPTTGSEKKNNCSTMDVTEILRTAYASLPSKSAPSSAPSSSSDSSGQPLQEVQYRVDPTQYPHVLQPFDLPRVVLSGREGRDAVDHKNSNLSEEEDPKWEQVVPSAAIHDGAGIAKTLRAAMDFTITPVCSSMAQDSNKNNTSGTTDGKRRFSLFGSVKPVPPFAHDAALGISRLGTVSAMDDVPRYVVAQLVQQLHQASN